MTENLQTFPSNIDPIADPETGIVTQSWLYLLQALFRRTGGSGAVLEAEDISVTASPFAYEAMLRGSVVVFGGTVSQITLTRGSLAIPTGMTAGIIPVLPDDIVTVTYSVLPTITFLPSESTE